VVSREAHLFVKTATIGGHQIDFFALSHRWVGEQRLHDSAAQSLTLLVARHHYIPKNCSKHSITGRPADANKPPSLPGTHNTAAAQQHAYQGPSVPPDGPEAIGIEKVLDLVDFDH